MFVPGVCFCVRAVQAKPPCQQQRQQFAVCFSPRQRLRHTCKYAKSHQNNGWVPCPPDLAVPGKVARDIQRLRSQGPTDSFGLLSCVVPWGFAVGVQGVCGGSGRAVGGQQATTQAAVIASSMVGGGLPLGPLTS